MLTKIATLRASSALTAVGTENGTALKLDENYDQLIAVLNVTAAATDVGDTLDVYIDTSFDGGNSYVNIGHFTQVLGNGGAKKFIMSFVANPIATSNCTAFGTDQSAGNAMQVGFGDYIRCRSVLADSGTQNASFTYSVTVHLKK